MPRFPRRLAYVLAAAAILLILGWIGLRALRHVGDASDSRSSGQPAAPKLTVYYKSSVDAAGYNELNRFSVPLPAGALIWFHGKLTEPGYPYLFLLREDGQPQRLYPDADSLQGPLSEFYDPPRAEDPDRQRWHCLEPPAGTVSLLLLVADGPIADLEGLAVDLASFTPPELDPYSLLIGDAEQPVLYRNTNRGLRPDAALAPRGLLRGFASEWRSKFRHIQLLAFPYVETNRSEEDRP